MLLEDGTRFDGIAVGAPEAATGEVVFTTGMSGYQESVTDPSFAGQIITFTYPHIGNYGVSEDAMESERIWARAVIMRAAMNTEDAPGAERGWCDWLVDCGIPAISEVDTRALVRHIREAGSMRGGVFPASMAAEDAMALVRAEPPMAGADFARVVSPREMTVHGSGDGPRIAAIDTGIKSSIVRHLVQRGAVVELHPCATSAADLLAGDPDAIFLANGPGDPAALDHIVDTLRELVGVKPVFGICLGHQLLCRAVGLQTFKLPFGHRGGNHPVKDLQHRQDRDHLPEPRLRGARARTGSRRSPATSRCAGRPTSAPPSCRTSTSTTARSRGSPCSTSPAPRCSTTPRPAPGRTTASTSSTASSTRSPAVMPRRDDIQRILILGSGPIVIGQAAEFDYSGVQACKVLKEEGYEVVLVNSNPATIMTDPEFADATYVEPLLPGPVRQVIAKERPDALLPTLGGQTALNLAKALHEDGTLEEFGVELIGANYAAICRAEDRDEFRVTMEQAGLKMPRSAIATTAQEADDAMIDIGLPIIVRPAYTLGGRGGGIARTPEEFRRIVRGGLEASPISQILLDESVIGWGEFELEVMRDHNDNCVIVCSIENIDPMGVHTGDSVTVAPAADADRPPLSTTS